MEALLVVPPSHEIWSPPAVDDRRTLDGNLPNLPRRAQAVTSDGSEALGRPYSPPEGQGPLGAAHACEPSDCSREVE